MNGQTVFEFDVLVERKENSSSDAGTYPVPPDVFSWLEEQCLSAAAAGDAGWVRMTQRKGRRAVQVTNFVGVVRAPGGYQIEVLPKVGKVAPGGGAPEARKLLIGMLSCLREFRHIQIDRAQLLCTKMPLLEIFVNEFLLAVRDVVKRGLRGEYRQLEDNLASLRGKLLVSAHLRHNMFRADRFFTQHDEFSTDRAENRLLHSALQRVLRTTRSQTNQRLARELSFVFADVPQSRHIGRDFQSINVDRGMGHYPGALTWARIILANESPLTGLGRDEATSLLFPMESLFEAYVAKHLRGQLRRSLVLNPPARVQHLVRHRGQGWFQLRPDLLVCSAGVHVLVLDTKWKLLDAGKGNGTEKYNLAQSDFYQLQAYGLSYLKGTGDLVLIYPRTEQFDQPLEMFTFTGASELRLWVIPFCLQQKCLVGLAQCELSEFFEAS